MAVTQTDSSWQMTAAADAIAYPLKLQSVRWSGTGLTVGQELIVREKSGGKLIVRHLVELTTEDVEFITSSPYWVGGLYIEAIPATGGGKLNVVVQ